MKRIVCEVYVWLLLVHYFYVSSVLSVLYMLFVLYMLSVLSVSYVYLCVCVSVRFSDHHSLFAQGLSHLLTTANMTQSPIPSEDIR